MCTHTASKQDAYFKCISLQENCRGTAHHIELNVYFGFILGKQQNELDSIIRTYSVENVLRHGRKKKHIVLGPVIKNV